MYVVSNPVRGLLNRKNEGGMAEIQKIHLQKLDIRCSYCVPRQIDSRVRRTDRNIATIKYQEAECEDDTNKNDVHLVGNISQDIHPTTARTDASQDSRCDWSTARYHNNRGSSGNCSTRRSSTTLNLLSTCTTCCCCNRLASDMPLNDCGFSQHLHLSRGMKSC